MTCSEARTDLALAAGGDLDDRARVKELRQHMAACADCRQHFQSLRSTLKSMASVSGHAMSGGATWESHNSLWPAVRRELARPRGGFSASSTLRQLRNWTPFAAMTAACLVMLFTLNRFGGEREEPLSSRGINVQPPVALQPEEASPSERHRDSESRPDARTAPPARF